jgi:hypothetical protein
MAVIITVGPGGDFDALQAAFNSVPEPLDDEYRIQLLHHEFAFTGNDVPLAIGARTTTPTNQLIIEAAPGASFRDNRANPMRYDASAGAAIKAEDASCIIFGGVVNHLTIRGIQFLQNATAASGFDILLCQPVDVSTNKVIEACLVEQRGSLDNDCMFLTGISKIINCIVIHGGNSPASAIKLSDAAGGYQTDVIGCTIVRPSELADEGIGLWNKFADNVFRAKNNAVFGFLTDASQLTAAGADYNATDHSDAGSGFPDPGTDHNVYDVAYGASLFEQPSSSGLNHDYRLKAGTRLENAGLFDANSPADISGLARNNPPEIGAWEISATLRPRRNMTLPATTAIGIDLTKITNSPFKSDIFPIHDASRLTLEVQADQPASAGSWVIKAVPAPDNTIDGQVLVTTNFPATPADVSSATAEVAHMWGYVQQVTPISGASLVRVIVYKQ